MALTFPDTPVIGQEVYSDTKKYTWDGVKWKVSPVVIDWVRPTDWLTMPEVLITEQKFVGLYAVFPHDAGLENSSNFVAIYVQCSVAGVNNISIDWGDGVTELVAHNAIAQHLYDYNAISSTTNCSRGYRQVRIVVTPVAVNLTGLYLNTRHSSVPFASNSNWLDILCSLPNTTAFTCYSSYAPARILENVKVLSLGAITSYESIFAYCNALRVVTMPVNVPTLTNIRFMFTNCISLTTVNLFDTSNVIDCTGMFYQCRSIRTVPNFDIGRATIILNMFFSCTLLTSVPLLNISANTGLPIAANGMFAACSTLTEVPLLNFSNVSNFSSLFTGCSLLRTIPAIDTSKGTLFDSMFTDCYDLISIPYLDTSKGTSFNRFAQAATSLQSCTPLNFINSVPGGALQIFNSAYSVADATITNLKYSFSVTQAKFSQKTLTTIISNLPSLPTIAVSFAGTGVQATSIVISVGHGLVNTAPIKFQVINTTTGITVGTTYYVINATTDTYQVSLTSGGVAVIFGTGNGTGTCSLNSTITLSNNVGTGGTHSYTNCATTAGSKSIVVTSPFVSSASTTAPNIVTTGSLHNFLLNQKITFRSINGTPGITANTEYYVVNILGSQTFQVSLTENGTPITLLTVNGHSLLLAPLGSQVTGTGSPLTTPIVMAFTANKIVLTNHQLQTNDIVSFPVVTNNLVTYTPYYIVGTPNANDFQIATTLGGAAITFTDGTGTMLYDSILESISGTASPFTFTMSRPMAANGTGVTLAFRPLKTSIALFKNWTVA